MIIYYLLGENVKICISLSLKKVHRNRNFEEVKSNERRE